MKAPPRRICAPEALTAFAMPTICSSLSTLHGPRDHHEVPAADAHVPDLHDGVVRVELAVAALERLRDALDGIYDAKTGDKVHIDPARVTHETENGLILADGGVDLQSLLLQPVNKLVFLLFGSAVFQNDDHRLFLQKQKSRHSVI